ncbi:MAG: Ig-like domain-containing protein [Ilumatobacteraceae bacterium]
MADEHGLWRVEMSGGDVVPLAPADSAPTRPIWLNRCAYGAWTLTSVRVCNGNLSKGDETPDEVAPPKLRTNRGKVVVNTDSGKVYLFGPDGTTRVDNWDDAFNPEDKKEPDAPTTETEEVEETCDRGLTNLDPTAQDDTFVVRQGETALLDVLYGPGGDSDPNCDVLVIQPIVDFPDERGEVSLAKNGRLIQYSAAPDFAEPFEFEYTIGDGRGGTDTATVKVTVVPQDSTSNQDPKAVNDKNTVEAGGVVVHNVLANDSDPDGDDLIVTGASWNAGQVVFQPNGRVTFTAPSDIGPVDITYSISDGRDPAGTATGTLTINVIPVATNFPPEARNDFAVGLAGQVLSVRPLDNDSDPNNDRLRVTTVDAIGDAPSAALVTKETDGSVTFQASVAGTYLYKYGVVDESNGSAEAFIRVDVLEAGEQHVPVVVKDEATITPGKQTFVDVLANDVDVDGDVLVIQRVELGETATQQIAVEIIEHRLLRVTIIGSVRDGQRIPFTYRVSDGTNEVVGAVTLRVVAVPGGQPPIAIDDVAEVHMGGALSIPALANDTDPDGDLVVLTDVVLNEGERGELFVQGDQIRYVAPDAESAAEADYTVNATYTISDGSRTAGASLTIAVRNPSNGNKPPRPPELQARTFSGMAVDISLPKSGLDPDGDPVKLLGLDSAPLHGQVTIVDGTFTYEPVARQSGVPFVGTDVFTYRLQDSQGASGIGTVRITIAARPPNSAPVAVADEAQVKPGGSVTIAVLENDSDADGDELVFLETDAISPPPTGKGEVEIVGDRSVRFIAPDQAQTVPFTYGISDGRGGIDYGTVTVEVTPNIANKPPVAVDDLLEPKRPGEVVDFDVTLNDYDPDNQPSGGALAVTVVAPGVTVLPDGKTISFVMGDNARTFTYLVGDGELSSYAVVQVPKWVNSPPEIAPIEIDMAKEQSSIDIPVFNFIKDNDPGDVVTIDEDFAPEVRTPGAGTAKWNGNQLTFTREAEFAGDALVVFRVTDDAETGAELALGSVIVHVAGTQNQPPVVDSTEIELAAGDSLTISLRTWVKDPDPEDEPNLQFSDVQSQMSSLQIDPGDDGSLTLSALTDAITNGQATAGQLTFVVDDGRENGQVTGTLSIRIVSSKRPAPVANPDTMPDVKQGSPGTFDPTANDFVDSKLTPLTIVGIGAVAPDSAGTVTFEGTNITFTAKPGFHGQASFLYTIVDATNDSSRQSSNTVTVAVKDKPDKPGRPTVGPQLSATAEVSFAPPPDNGAPIDQIEMETEGRGSTTCASSPCVISSLTNGQSYRFRLRAHNEVDWSDWSDWSDAYEPDELPGQPNAPSAVWGDGSATVSWGSLPNNGSPIIDVTVSVTPATVTVNPVAAGQNSIVIDGLTNGTEYTFTLSSRNNKGSSPTSGPSSGVIPAGKPKDLTAPTAVAGNGTVSVSWAAPNGNGDNAMTYTLYVFDNSGVNPGPIRTIPGLSGLSTDVAPLTNGTSYSFKFNATNKAGTSLVDSPMSSQAVPMGPPLQPASVTATPGNGSATLNIGATDSNGSAITDYKVSVNGGAWQSVGNTTTPVIGSLVNGQSYRFRVRAVNIVGDGEISAETNPAVIPFGPPVTPSVSVSRSGLTLTWTWSLGSPNGSTPTSGSVTVNGLAVPANYTDGTYSQSFGAGQTLTLRVTYLNAQGASSYGEATATIPSPSVSITKGAVGSHPTCSYPCWNLVVNASGMNPGQNYSITCFPGTGDEMTWTSSTYTANSSGDFSVELVGRCWAGTGLTFQVRVGPASGGVTGTQRW